MDADLLQLLDSFSDLEEKADYAAPTNASVNIFDELNEFWGIRTSLGCTSCFNCSKSFGNSALIFSAASACILTCAACFWAAADFLV